MVLTARRLAKLATWEGLRGNWFLIAAVTLTVCNRPQEIPRLYHYALNVEHLQAAPNDALYEQVETILAKYAEAHALGCNLDYSPYAEHHNRTLYVTTDKFREGILKTAALSGLPKCINALMQLKDNTPFNLRAQQSNRPPITCWEDYTAVQNRGKMYWDSVYTKISGRVQRQMETSYPDLWGYTLSDVYGPLLSYNEVLTPVETSLVVIASLIPQNVNPQLKGHLKGALNGGVPIETLRAGRAAAIAISQWCKVDIDTENVAQI